MNLEKNPFEFDAANNLTDEMIVDYFIDDFNYSRFIQSKRNVFLVGDRGSGKTMALLFNRWRLQRLRAEKEGDHPDLGKIGVYVPCNTPLTHKTEYQLLGDEFRAAALSEHFLVLSITHGLVETLLEIPGVLDGADESRLRSEAAFVLGGSLPEDGSFLEAVRQFLQRELLNTQRVLNSSERKAFYENTFSFASVFVPVIGMCSRRIPVLKESHFLLLIDDAQALNPHQIRALNSWIAYRDHSLFSFKVAVARIGTQTRITTAGGSILEGHDYTRVDLEGPYQNRDSRFYRHARTLIARRLEKAGIESTAENFFPVSTAMKRDLEAAEEAVRQEAIRKYGDAMEMRKAVGDYIYKYRRAHYFRERSPRANRPPYSGFETLVYLSTGVVRNLLEPCFWMFDRAVSESREVGASEGRVRAIATHIQTEVILERSKRLWVWLEEGISQDIDGCSNEDGVRAHRLLTALAIHFRYRLRHHPSEPCALSFTISGQECREMSALVRLLDILRKAQLIYLRSGSAKDEGKRETYYVPNRMLWPVQGLDPHGQHARVSLSASSLWAAAGSGKIGTGTDGEQRGLWDEEE